MLKLNLTPCQPPSWAKSGHAQTIWGHLIPSPQLDSFGKRHELLLADGDRLVNFVHVGTGPTVIYLFHGLGGHSSSDYMRRMALVAKKLDATVILSNHRGCGEGAGLASQPYHSGRAEDLSSVIEFGKTTFPNKRHLAIGFSLSGNALLLLMSGVRGSTQPDLAISVNAPIHLKSASIAIGRGLNRIYDARFVRLCKQYIDTRVKAGLLNKTDYPLPRFLKLHDFDELYTGRASGFSGRDEYYEKCSAHLHLDKIKKPTFILTAKDDPFVNYKDYLRAQLPSSVALHIEETGGHMGYLNRKKLKTGSTRWLDYALEEAILGLLRN